MFFFMCALSFVNRPAISAQNLFLLSKISLGDFIGSRFLYVRYTLSSKHACHVTVDNVCNMAARHDVCSMSIVLPDQVRSLPRLAFVVVVFAFVGYWNTLVSCPRLRRCLGHYRFRAAKAPNHYVNTFSVDLVTVDLDLVLCKKIVLFAIVFPCPTLKCPERKSNNDILNAAYLRINFLQNAVTEFVVVLVLEKKRFFWPCLKRKAGAACVWWNILVRKCDEAYVPSCWTKSCVSYM